MIDQMDFTYVLRRYPTPWVITSDGEMCDANGFVLDDTIDVDIMALIVAAVNAFQCGNKEEPPR